MYPLCFTPDKKVSMEDVCQIYRNRYEGTEYSPDETGRGEIRVIGTETTLSAHVLQVYPDLPAEMSCVSWVSSGPAVCGVYVPVSNDRLNVSEAYGANQPANEKETFDTDHYPYYVFKELCDRGIGPENYKPYGKPVQAYWKEAEANMFTGMSEVIKKAEKIEDKETRAKYITAYCNEKQSQAFADGQEILNDVTWTQNKNSKTLKVKLNPETHELTGEKIEIPPMNISLNATKYKHVPEVPNGGFEFKLPFT